MAPVQTADPGNYGSTEIRLLAGVNLVDQSGLARGHRIGLEAGLPVYRDLNGPQLETDYTITVGYQYAF